MYAIVRMRIVPARRDASTAELAAYELVWITALPEEAAAVVAELRRTHVGDFSVIEFQAKFTSL